MTTAIIKLTEPQNLFIHCGESNPAIVGGLGSGKSFAGIMRLIKLMLENVGANGGYYLPTYDLIRLRAMPGVEETLDLLGIGYTVNKSTYSIKIHGYGDIIFRSYDCPERIVAFEVAFSIVDELDILSKEKAAIVWRKVSERNRQNVACGNSIGLVCTPDSGINGFVYDKWVKRKQDGYVLYKASTYSNPFLPKGYAEQILANYDEVLANLYLNGEFVSLNQNKIYHFYDRKRHASTRTIQPTDHLHIGLDFNVGGTCATVFVIDGDIITAVEEFVSHDTQDFINNLTRYDTLNITIYPDASGNSKRTNASESDIAMIRRAEYKVKHLASNPAVRDRINAVNGLLSHNRLFVNADKCPELATALESQGYDKRGEPEKYTVHPAVDDRCFSGDTKIIVNDVLIEFKDIPKKGLIRDYKGDNILFYNGGYKGHEKIFNILLNNGKIIRSTNDHEFLTLNGWIKAENLAGETLCNIEYYQKQPKNLTGLNITKALTGIFIKRWAAVKHCTEEKQGNQYTEQYGNIITERLKKALLFITLTKTKAIMIFQTLLPCTNQNTILCTSQSGINNTLNIQELQLKKHSQNVKNGTLHKLVKNGINRIMKTTKDCFIKKSLENVKYAQRNMSEETTEEIYTAQGTAKHKRDVIAELITKQGLAKRVIMRLLSTNTIKHNTVVKAVQKSQKEEPVYCLTTEQGCFSLADGNIVSNCDSAGYAIAFLYPIKIERPVITTQHTHRLHNSSWQS